ncbi:MAG TPA: DUF1326 domain-containing protein [Gemmatimonadales bacterium]|nr:DUF1326 domain-containing protein [Gemmatimonadales bacterium]
MGQTTAGSAPLAATGQAPPWRVTVHSIEACNCRPGCNCQFTGFPDFGGCEAMIGGEVQTGRYGGVSLDGVRYVIAFTYPGAIHEGGGSLAVFIDERASSAQAEAVATILSGRAGGMPFEALAGTVASLEGPVLAPIEMTVDGTRSSFRIPGVLELIQTPIRDAVSGAEKAVQIVYPNGGFFWNVGNVATSATMSCDYGLIRFRHPGGFASYATPTWSNQA